LAEVLDVALPDAGFYLWAKVDKLVSIGDAEYAKQLYAEYNVTVLPGSYVAREAHGWNPGANRIRMALVAEVDNASKLRNVSLNSPANSLLDVAA